MILVSRRWCLGLSCLALGCYPALQLTPDDSNTVLARHTIDAPNPAAPGPYGVRTLYYGSGTDRHRPEYRDSVAITTQPVDASKLVDLGATARTRNAYWGFTPKEMPLNARVWYPDGDGPFPLVLVVHGNHDMKDFSDPGYDYLGELLASRGYILASVDMNFINGAIRGENDARGWFLLKHVEAWRDFNGTEDGPFAGKVDLGRITLIGHSRGGEAVGHAAAFNRLRHYPDDASLSFDFDFDIRSIIAIAPVDGQYQPSDRLVPVENVSYLVFHGSHDGDVTSFAGLRTWQRLAFTDDEPRFKAAVYVYRANHGQWNTVWGAHDNGPRSPRILDLRALLEPEEQRDFARVYISAFLEATLRNDERYLPLFRDHRVAGHWLPPTMYVTRYEDSSFRTLADFEDGIDVTSGSVAGVRIRGDSLATWREGVIRMRGAGTASFENKAVWLGWNNRIAGDDTTRMGPAAAYVLQLPDTLARAWRFDEGAALQFALLPTDALPGPRAAPKDTTAAADSAAEPAATRRPPSRQPRQPRRAQETKPPIDLSIELVDAHGTRGSVPLSAYGPLRRPLDIRVWRRADRERAVFTQMQELVLQTYTVPLGDFLRAGVRAEGDGHGADDSMPGGSRTEVPSGAGSSADGRALDLERIVEVRFMFDRAVAGTVILDDIGVARLDAGSASALRRLVAAGTWSR